MYVCTPIYSVKPVYNGTARDMFFSPSRIPLCPGCFKDRIHTQREKPVLKETLHNVNLSIVENVFCTKGLSDLVSNLTRLKYALKRVQSLVPP